MINNQLSKCISTLFDGDSVETSEDKWRTVTQILYDNIKTDEGKLGISRSREVLPQLFVNDMSAEQIWQQIEFQNDLVISMTSINVSDNAPNLCMKIAQLCNQVNYNADKDDDDDNESEDEKDDSDDEDNDTLLDDKNSEISFEDNDKEIDEDLSGDDLSDDKEMNDDLSDTSDLDKDTFGDIALEGDEDDSEDEEDDDDYEKKENVDDNDSGLEEPSGSNQFEKSKSPPRNFNRSAVDSTFFNLRQSEWIADNDIIGENVGDEIDLMKDEDSEEEERNEPMYNDFFDQPQENSNTIGEEGIEENNSQEVKSKFSAKLDEEYLVKRGLEDDNFLNEKPWVFKGEVKKEDRPKNSVLEHHLEFRFGVRHKPIITEETTKNIEKLILSRIRAQAWDDVERKIKPVVDPVQYKQKLILDQEKSKKSLASIYEEEFLKKQEDAEGNQQTLNSVLSESDDKFEELPLHKEIKKEMQDLFMKLDALSNYHFTPKYKPPEVKVVSNLPSIRMEESTPSAVSDATLLAPQEIVAPIRGELKGETEKEKTDRKRERRGKKKHQKLRAKREEEKLKHQMKKRGKDGLLQAEASMKIVQKALKKGQIKVLEKKPKGVKPSSLSELQNNITARTTKRKAEGTLTVGTRKKKKGNPLTMSKLLL